VRKGLLALLLGVTGLAQADAPVHPHALQLLDTWLSAQQTYLKLPSLSVAVQHGEAPVWSRGYGHIDLARKLPATGQSIYGICSISKLFTSVAVLQQVDAGRFKLDDPIEPLVPGLKLPAFDAASGPVTVRSLLTHSGGLAREAAVPYWAGPPFRFPDRAALLAAVPPAFMPVGERMQYSNLGMALLGEAVAQAAGLPYASWVQQRILTPLGMKDSAVGLPAERLGMQLSQAWSAVDRQGNRQPLPVYDAAAMAPSAGLSASMEDLARFAAWQFRVMRTGQAELLQAASLREMQRVQWRDPDGKRMRGLGYRISEEEGEPVLMHDGQCPGQLTELVLLPKQRLALALGLSGNENTWIDTMLGKPARDLLRMGLKLPAPDAAVDARLADFVGRYDDQPWSSEITVLPWGAQLLMLTLPSADPAGDLQRLTPVGPDRFRVEREDGSLAEEVRFERDAQGRVKRFVVWDQPTPRFKKP